MRCGATCSPIRGQAASAEGLLHPLIRAENRAPHGGRRAGAYVVQVVPLLLESGDYRKRVARVTGGRRTEEVQVKRVMARSGLASARCAESWRTRPRAPRGSLRPMTSSNNAGTLDALASRWARCTRKYLKMASRAKS